MINFLYDNGKQKTEDRRRKEDIMFFGARLRRKASCTPFFRYPLSVLNFPYDFKPGTRSVFEKAQKRIMSPIVHHTSPLVPRLSSLVNIRFQCLFYFLLTFSFFLFPSSISANNIEVENGTLTNYLPGSDTYDIEFDLSWDNSWRTPGAPSLSANWDAAWVFVKFSKYSGGTWSDWDHAILATSGSVMIAGSSTATFADNGDGKPLGAFIYRDAANTGTGANDWDNLRLQWDYGEGGTGGTLVADGDTLRIKVFAIEMVHVPECNFFIGDSECDQDGNILINAGCGASGAGAVRISTTITDALCTEPNDYDTDVECAHLAGNGTGTFCVDGDGGIDHSCNGIENTFFPTGYRAFYLMKYEVTQKQYVDFLNTLNGTQQSVRSGVTTVGNYMNDDGTTDTPQNRGGIKCRVAPVGSAPGVYGNDLDNDDVYDGDNDGQWIAANWLSWMDLTAYADWAALRPLTELEFEKAARGGQLPVDDEYACGGSNEADLAYTLDATAGASNEVIASNYEADPECNMMTDTTNGAITGPLRTGIFADDNSTRKEAGMAYFGAMELSGNLWERTVTFGNSTGRLFNGTHGDGNLVKSVGAAYDGNATNTDWPGISGTAAQGVTGASGSGFRGGAWSYGSAYARVSARSSASSTAANRPSNYGGRLSRTSP